MILFQLNPKHQRLASALLLLALATFCQLGGWYIWPGLTSAETLGEVRLRWLVDACVSLYCWWQGCSLAIWTLFGPRK